MDKISKDEHVAMKVQISYDEIYGLVGQLLTINDATARDNRQLNATKQLIKQTTYNWLDALYADQYPKEKAEGLFDTPKKSIEITEDLAVY